MKLVDSDNPNIRRCPKCNALTRSNSGECAECKLFAAHPCDLSHTQDRDVPIRKMTQFIAGLGIPIDQLASVVACIMVLGFRFVYFGFGEGLVTGAYWMLLPMLLIWFSDTIGGFTGFTRSRVAHECHPSFVKFVGWLGILAVMAYSVYRTSCA